MQIDPSQPIMFDSETMPGLGAGTWQMHPNLSGNRTSGNNHPTDKVSRIARMIVGILIGGGLVVATINAAFW